MSACCSLISWLALIDCTQVAVRCPMRRASRSSMSVQSVWKCWSCSCSLCPLTPLSCRGGTCGLACGFARLTTLSSSAERRHEVRGLPSSSWRSLNSLTSVLVPLLALPSAGLLLEDARDVWVCSVLRRSRRSISSEFGLRAEPWLPSLLGDLIGCCPGLGPRASGRSLGVGSLLLTFGVVMLCRRPPGDRAPPTGLRLLRPP
mmetsp:Transcript_1564/g.4606  ORF Transcript_1564/g.4606 Transcript_1564/m.4606 type:complete len:203 (-) Transcript_1564:83-691(-)